MHDFNIMFLTQTNKKESYFIMFTYFKLPYLLEWAPLLERAPPLLKISDYIGQKQRIAFQCVKNNLKN